jgi:hypothetical protein
VKASRVAGAIRLEDQISEFPTMTTRFRRAIARTQRCISLILVMDQDQQRVRRQTYLRHEALRSNFSSREILPSDEKLRAAFFHLRNRFQIWIARLRRAKPAKKTLEAFQIELSPKSKDDPHTSRACHPEPRRQ